MANVVGLVPIMSGVIRMALLAEEPQPHTTGSWEGQRVLADAIGTYVVTEGFRAQKNGDHWL